MGAGASGGAGGSSRELEFWRWFAEQAEKLASLAASEDATDNERLLAEVKPRLGQVAPGLAFLMGRTGEGPWEFIVSADGREERFPLVDALVAAAPHVPGWRITGFRPRWPVHPDTVIGYRGEQVRYGDVWWQADVLSDGRLELVLWIRGLTEQNYEARAGAAILLLDHALGEYDSVKKIAGLSAEGLPEGAIADGLRPLAELPGWVDSLDRA